MDEDSLIRERAFHNQIFSTEGRAKVGRFYAAAEGALTFYSLLLRKNGPKRECLEYGCGLEANSSRFLAKLGAKVHGIDISDVAIKVCTDSIGGDFRVMDAHKMSFSDQTFDLVCGSGILHHLDLAKAYSEVARVLRPNGKAIFLEPMGHNPVFNLYRRLSPELRTVDEHPLKVRDLRLARKYFRDAKFHFFALSTFAAVPFRNTLLFAPVGRLCSLADSLLFTTPLKLWAWIVVMELSN